MAIYHRKCGHYDLSYQVRGRKEVDRETIVFIHGLGFSQMIWDTLLEKLEPQFQLVVYDLAGHHKSGVYHGTLTWEFFCSELFDLLDHLDIKSCHLVGHGLGGIVAMKAVNIDDERFQSLSLISTPLYFPDDLFRYEYDVRFELLEQRRMDFAHEMMLNTINQTTPEKIEILENAFRMVDERMYKDSVKLVFASYEGFMNDLRTIHIPTLVMGGELDPVFPVNYTAIYSSYLSKSRLRIIPNASNAAFMDDPDYVAESLSTFIEDRNRLYFSKSHDFLMHKINNILEKGRLVDQEEATLHINAINTFSIQWRKQKVTGKWNQRFAKELLLYLVLKVRVTREELVEAFHPDTDATNGRNYLRVMLNHLKQILANFSDERLVNGLVIERQFIHLDLHVNSDLKYFLHSISHFDKLPAVRQLDTILYLLRQYRYTFMPGFDAPWINELKAMIDERLGHYMMEVSDACANEGDQENAVLVLMEGSFVEPYEGYCKERIAEIRHPYNPSSFISPPIG